MTKKIQKHSLVDYEETAAMLGNEIRLKMKEKDDGAFRVIAQRRSGAGTYGKLWTNIFSLGLALPRTVFWRKAWIEREYATREEASSLMKAFNAKVEKKTYDRTVAHIPAEDRERYAKEKGIKIPQSKAAPNTAAPK